MLEYRKSIEPLQPYVPGRPIDDVKKEYSLEDVVKIASNENPYGCSPNVKQAIIDSVNDTYLYPDGYCTELRAAIADFYGISFNSLVFGSGTDEIISMIGKVFVNPGDECITAETTFSQYAASVEAMGGTMVYTPMKYYGFDLDAILGKINDRTKLIFVANPNNPTGSSHKNAQQLAFLKEIPRNILVVFDEAYYEFSDDKDYPKTLEHMNEYKNIMLLKTFSKAYGLAAMRVGFGVADQEIIQLFEKIRNPFNVSAPAQVAARAAILDQDFIKSTHDKNIAVRDFLCKSLDEMGLFYIPTQANFIMFDAKIPSAKLFVDLMRKGYIIRPGVAFGMDTFIRASIGTFDQMEGFINALKEVTEVI